MNGAVNLDKDPIKSLFFNYYFPALASLLSVTIHQIVNGLILGHFVGKAGVAAVGLFGPILIVFIAFALALMIGGGILIAKNIGAKDYDQAQQVFQFTTSIALVFGGVIALSSPFITKPITNFLVGNDGADIARSTHDYMFWGFIWLPFFFVRMLWSNFVTNDGNPKVSRNASLLAVAINIVLDYLLIVVFPFGTAGASIATGLSILGGLVYLFVYMTGGKGHLSVKRFRLTFKFSRWRELLKFGVPSFVSEISFSLGLLLINKSLIPFGALAIAAFGLVNHLSFIFIRLFTAAMISVLPIIGFNIGASLPKRVLETLQFALVFTFVLGILVSITGFMFSEFLVTVFSGKDSPDFQTQAVHAMGMYFTLFLAAGPNYILGVYLQSIGKSSLSIAANLLKGVVLVGAFLLVLPRYFEMGLNGIWLSRSFAEIGTLVIVGCFVIYNRWNYFSDENIVHKNVG